MFCFFQLANLYRTLGRSKTCLGIGVTDRLVWNDYPSLIQTQTLEMYSPPRPTNRCPNPATSVTLKRSTVARSALFVASTQCYIDEELLLVIVKRCDHVDFRSVIDTYGRTKRRQYHLHLYHSIVEISEVLLAYASKHVMHGSDIQMTLTYDRWHWQLTLTGGSCCLG